MNTELAAMIEAGRKLIETQSTAEQLKAAEAETEGLRPEPTPEPELVPALLPPPPAERIAAALERIATVLEGFSDNSEANDALRVNVLR